MTEKAFYALRREFHLGDPRFVKTVEKVRPNAIVRLPSPSSSPRSSSSLAGALVRSW